MNIINTVIQRPAWAIAFWLLIGAIGLVSYNFMPVDLFPDTMPPQVVAMTVVRGASADDVSRRVTTLIDRELKGLKGIIRVVSTSRDEVSSVNAQFDYGTDMSQAMTDVINAVNRVTRSFPAGTQPTQFFRITDANRPVVTLALKPAQISSLDLKAIRILAENDIKEDLLRLRGIGRIDVFGANEPEILVRMDLEKLRQFKIAPAQVLKAIGAQNTSLPGGYLENGGRESLVKTLYEARTPEQLAGLPIRVQNGGVITLADVASVTLGIKTSRSIYHGNGSAAIALNILKPEDGFAVDGIESIKKYLPELQKRYPEIDFAITTDQEPIISVNVRGMKDSLFSAVWLTMLIVFLLLQNLRASVVVGVSIPLSFLSAFAFLYFTPFTLNMVTLSGLIIAVGMVVDASIVVVENVYRHLENGTADLEKVVAGTEEVVFSIWGGMLTTVVVMIPIMFVGGYVQQVLRPLTMTISATLVGSFFAAVTIVPILLKKLLVDMHVRAAKLEGSEEEQKAGFFFSVINRLLDASVNIYLSLLHLGLKMRVPLLIASFIVLALSARTVLPLVGRELMPRMDTGMIIIKADLPPSMTAGEVEKSIEKIEKIIGENPHVLNISTVAGSEPGQVSFGAGGQLLQQVDIQVRLTTRDRRSQTIWEISRDWRAKLHHIPELVAFSVSEFGATPMATSRAPIDVMISGRDPDILYQLAESLDAKLRKIDGLQDLRFTWAKSKPETHFSPDLSIAGRYQLTPVELGEFLGLTFSGRIPGALKMKGLVDLSIRAELGEAGQRWQKQIDDLVIPGPAGELFLGSLGTSRQVLQPTLVTRENLSETINITGLNSIRPLSAVAEDVSEVLAASALPAGYRAELSGTMADIAETGRRLGKVLGLGLMMLYVVLYLLFENWWRPFLVMVTIPLSLIGALWGLLIFDKPMCMPAMMGIILLGGTIVNNAIILIDFIDSAVKKGVERRQALEDAVKTRFRPILITTLSTILGLIPLILEQAVGLERMSPLGVVASAGLLVGTVMTMVMIPVLYDLIMSVAERLSALRVNAAGKTVAVVLIALSFAGTAQAEGITIEECLQSALASAPVMLISETEIEAADGQIKQAAAALQPSVRLGAVARHWDQRRPGVLGAIPGAPQFFDENLSETQLQLRQLLWDSGRARSSFDAARFERDARKQQKDRIEQETIFSVLSAFLEVISQQATAEAVARNVEDVSAALTRMRKLKEVGRVANVDVLRLEVREQETLAQQETVRHGLVSNLARLARICGFQRAPEKVASEGIDIYAVAIDQTEDELLQTALQQRSDLIAGRLRVVGAGRAVRASDTGRQPVLNLLATGNSYGNDTGRTLNNGFVGIEFSWQLTDGGAAGGRRRQALAAEAKAKQLLFEAELRVAEQIRIGLSAAKTAIARLERSRLALELAEEAYRIQALNYEHGKGTVNDLLDAQAALFNARAQLVRDENDLLTARMALSLASGRLHKTDSAVIQAVDGPEAAEP
ncbi:MAG TPA: efflux RND transporter permease subunit [Candidatus Rifleibacterium sp.]|nr:efflux RND transporter permease subunit [Candidatus Rifleibacterium sp.]